MNRVAGALPKVVDHVHLVAAFFAKLTASIGIPFAYFLSFLAKYRLRLFLFSNFLGLGTAAERKAKQ